MKNQTDITILLDRSGSMETIRKDMEGAFNSFLDEQRRLGGDMRVTLYQFDTTLDKVYDRLPINEVPPLKIQPRGGTALVDAMVQVVDEVGRRFAALPEYERPERVVFLVVTDGEENSSRIYHTPDVLERTKRQKDQYNWNFIYLGANQDSFSVARSLGISLESTMNYGTTSANLKSMSRSLADTIGNYHVGASYSCSFTDKDREAQQGQLQFTSQPSKEKSGY